MNSPMSAEERYAKIREGVVALSLMQTRGNELLDEGFLEEGAQGGEALDHLRDALHDISKQHGVQAVFCVRCGGLVTGEDDPEEIEDETHARCAQTRQGGDEPCSP